MLPLFESVRSEADELLDRAYKLLCSHVQDPPSGERLVDLRIARDSIRHAREALHDAKVRRA